MIKTDKELKSKIYNIKKMTHKQFQSYLRLFFIERLLERISKSSFKDNIILKGGVLMINLMGSHLRLTRDIDSTLKNINFSESNLLKIFNYIVNIDVKDNVIIKIIKLEKKYA